MTDGDGCATAIDPDRLFGREYSVTLHYTVEYNLDVLAGPEEWQAIERAEDLAPVLHSKPTDWDLVHKDVEATRNIYGDDPDAPKAADWIDEPNIPSEETYWDDSRHFGGDLDGER